VSGSTGRLVRRKSPGLGTVFATLVALVASALLKPYETVLAAGTASDGPGAAASWTTGNKLAVGTSATKTSKIWFTAANGITSEVFYPRLDIPNMQDMQYIVTDGSSFVDLERDATKHEISMPDEKALEYTSPTRTSAQRSAGDDSDDAIWRLLQRFAVLVFDFTALHGQSEALALEQCVRALAPDDQGRATGLWAALQTIASDVAVNGGGLTLLP
jgi:hypothetical protein